MDLTEFTFVTKPTGLETWSVFVDHAPCQWTKTWRWSAFNLEQVLLVALSHKCPIPSTPPPDKERPQGDVVPIRPDEALTHEEFWGEYDEG